MSNKKPDQHRHLDEEISDDAFISRYSATEEELRETISYLIHRRELLRDMEIEQLESQAEMLMQELADNKRKMMLEELRCFKEVLSLHKRLLSRK